jgi:hypothetical protein
MVQAEQMAEPDASVLRATVVAVLQQAIDGDFGFEAYFPTNCPFA